MVSMMPQYRPVIVVLNNGQFLNIIPNFLLSEKESLGQREEIDNI